jgi:hypothetical protein
VAKRTLFCTISVQSIILEASQINHPYAACVSNCVFKVFVEQVYLVVMLWNFNQQVFISNLDRDTRCPVSSSKCRDEAFKKNPQWRPSEFLSNPPFLIIFPIFSVVAEEYPTRNKETEG